MLLGESPRSARTWCGLDSDRGLAFLSLLFVDFFSYDTTNYAFLRNSSIRRRRYLNQRIWEVIIQMIIMKTKKGKQKFVKYWRHVE